VLKNKNEKSHNAASFILSYMVFYLRKMKFHHVHLAAMSNFNEEFIFNKIFLNIFQTTFRYLLEILKISLIRYLLYIFKTSMFSG